MEQKASGVRGTLRETGVHGGTGQHAPPHPPTLSPQARGEGTEPRRTSPLRHVTRFGFAGFQRDRLQMIALDQRHLRDRKTHRRRNTPKALNATQNPSSGCAR